jgi:hypothetical protein
MIKPNWDVFKAKFSENPQFHFEWFCYLLFCKETNNEFGIFRYKNQSAIETNPVNFDGHCLGFQSKFYDTTLTSNKAELIGTLEKANRDYPKLTKLLLYTNKEWGQYYPNKKAEKPVGQKEIEEKANQLGILLEWRTASYFESPFVSQVCVDFSKYFFINDYSLLDIINAQERHTQSILKNIKQSISFNENEISIERVNVLHSLKETTSQISIVCGKGGVGKTVEIKKFYQESSNTQPIFAFKANEFEIDKLDDLTKESSIEEFLRFFNDCQDKVLIIDSAEKLMDLNNQEPIKEFIDLSVALGWRIIFTTRDHYFDDLNHMCIDVLNVIPHKLYIPELTEEELDALASRFCFKLPTDSRLHSLLKLPFYLNAFLKFYDDGTEQPLDSTRFKEHLWNKKIKSGHIKREKVFSELALQRVNTGKFYLSVTGEDLDAAYALSKDEVLGKKGTSFFISHDIYEEWALEKFIDTEFQNKLSTTEFFTSIGKHLAIRRSFRSWISEQLFANEKEIKPFIENAIDNDVIEPIWKDELITAILLSDYSFNFFDVFENELLQNNLELLQRINFILRITCKEIDNSMLNLLGLKKNHITHFTIPKGAGWSAFINFIFDKKDNIGLINLKTFIPVLHEWNSSVKQGETTRKASLLCLEYYRWLESEDSYISSGKFTDSVIKTIAYGANEIKAELALVIDEICGCPKESKDIPYEHIAKLILKEIDGLYIAKALPEKTLELANKCWLKKYKPDHYLGSYLDNEQIFGIVDEHSYSYNPESAHQTPVFNLLSHNLKATIDFILDFTNKTTLNSVNYYGEEKFQTHSLSIDKQTSLVYLDQNLWGAYRGSDGTPELFKSILMALEKFFLERTKNTETETLEYWLKYLLKNTNSSAICGVVASIVIANNNRLFNVAKILFKVKEFIQYDNSRLIFDGQHKGQLEMFGNMFGGIQQDLMHHNERIKSCDEKHRNNCLERLFRDYQFFVADEKVKGVEFEARQKSLWDILDNYYKEVEEQADSVNVKLWRFSLARMDRRKINITKEIVENKVAITFNSDLDLDLKEMSNNHQKKQEQDYKYFPLNHWARNKLDQNKDFKKYVQYESNPQQAVFELKKLLEDLSDENSPSSDDFIHFNRATHIYSAVTLIKYHIGDISEDDIILCIDIVVNCLSSLFFKGRVSDGMEACFNILPELFADQDELRPKIKLFLITGLIRNESINANSQKFSIFAIQAMAKLCSKFDEDVQSIYIGYLLLNPIYIDLLRKIRQEHYEQNNHNVCFDNIWPRLFEENDDILDEVITNKIPALRLITYSNLDFHTQSVAFSLLPINQNKWSRDAFKKLVSASVNIIFTDKRSEANNYQSKKDFLNKFSHYILLSPIEELPELLAPFIDNFNSSKGAAQLLEEIIYTQDLLNSYENFWKIWELFKPKVIQISKEESLNYHSRQIIKAYLFDVYWKKDAKGWHTFKDKNKRFFKEMSEKLPSSPSTLYAFSKLLNNTGSIYAAEGIHWIANILKALTQTNIDENTIYYLNSYIHKYLYRERAKIRCSPEMMKETCIVLDFLIEQGEVSGYLMRESIV